MLKFLKTTLAGGLLFLLPLVILVAIVDKALPIAHRLVGPLAEHLPFDSVVGVGAPAVLAVVLVIVFCFSAGLLARTKLARRIVLSLETSVLSNIPGYDLVKNVSQDLLGVEEDARFSPVLVRFDEAWQIGFQIEVLDGGLVTVFIPDVPNPRSGAVFFVTADRVRAAGMPFSAAIRCLKRAGIGFGPHLKGPAMNPTEPG